jgi:hypothetical protein
MGKTDKKQMSKSIYTIPGSERRDADWQRGDAMSVSSGKRPLGLGLPTCHADLSESHGSHRYSPMLAIISFTKLLNRIVELRKFLHGLWFPVSNNQVSPAH